MIVYPYKQYINVVYIYMVMCPGNIRPRAMFLVQVNSFVQFFYIWLLLISLMFILFTASGMCIYLYVDIIIIISTGGNR